MEGITPRAMFATLQFIQQIIYIGIHVYLYFLMNIPRGLFQLPFIIIVFPLTTYDTYLLPTLSSGIIPLLWTH